MSRTAKRPHRSRLTPRQRQYRAWLRDPRWQKKRLEVMARDTWQCQGCGSRTKTLQVHHRWYTAGPPWEAPLAALVTVCVACHARAHRRRA